MHLEGCPVSCSRIHGGRIDRYVDRNSQNRSTAEDTYWYVHHRGGRKRSTPATYKKKPITYDTPDTKSSLLLWQLSAPPPDDVIFVENVASVSHLHLEDDLVPRVLRQKMPRSRHVLRRHLRHHSAHLQHTYRGGNNGQRRTRWWATNNIKRANRQKKKSTSSFCH